MVGVAPSELDGAPARRVLPASLLFVASFSAVFVALGAIPSAAALSRSAGHGALLLGLYSAGLAIPFLATALAFGRMTAVFASVRRHFPLVIAAGGAILVVMGVLIWTGELFALNIQAQRLMDRLGLDFLTSV